jgi:hypothetical protein
MISRIVAKHNGCAESTSSLRGGESRTIVLPFANGCSVPIRPPQPHDLGGAAREAISQAYRWSAHNQARQMPPTLPRYCLAIWKRAVGTTAQRR